MSTYILDTGFCIIIRDYYPDTFPSFWAKLDETIEQNIISSVSEAKKEIEQYGGEQKHLLEWIDKNKEIFTKPTIKEQEKVTEIFLNKHFQTLIPKKNILSGKPIADPFIIAKAIINKATVVTTEKEATKDKNGKIQGAYKIPDICKHFNIKCISPEIFMQQQKWQF